MVATKVRKNNLVDPRSATMEPVVLRRMPSSSQWRLYSTITMGIFIPLFSLGLSHVGGTLMRTGLADGNACLSALAGFAFLLMACVLAVSLSHLAWAVEDITKSRTWASWMLAIAFDLALVLGELCHVGAEGTVSVVVTIIMICVCGLSMFLNCWAFLWHPKKERREKKRRKCAASLQAKDATRLKHPL